MNTWECERRTFNGDVGKKEYLVARAADHEKAYHYVRGAYNSSSGTVFRGCLVGCSLNDLELYYPQIARDWGDHSLFELIGVPKTVAELADQLFENLPLHEATAFPQQFWSAVPVGVSLHKVWPQYAICLLTDAQYGAIQYAFDARPTEHVVALYQRVLQGDLVTQMEWHEALLPYNLLAPTAYSLVSVATDTRLLAVADASYAAAMASTISVTPSENYYREERCRQAHFLWQRDVLLKLLRSSQDEQATDWMPNKPSCLAYAQLPDWVL